MDLGPEGVVGVVRRRRVAVMLAADTAALLLSYALLAFLRYDDGATPWAKVAVIGGAAVAAHMIASWVSKLYRGRARVASAEETILLCAIALVTAIGVSALNVIAGVLIARSIPVGAAFTATALMVLLRALWRDSAERLGRPEGEGRSRTLVVGAGEAGTQLVRSMLGSSNSPYLPVALVDDDPWKRHLRLLGVPVRGTVADIARLVNKLEIQTVVVAVPSAPGTLIDTVVERTMALDVETKVLPPVADLLGSGDVTVRDVRAIDVTDVLGRGAIETDVTSIAEFLSGRRVLVTGAGGSIGSELARQVSQWQPAELMLLDRDESALHDVQLAIHGHGLLDSQETILADIRDEEAIQRIFSDRRPQVVFHAAALKHLPLLERYPIEGIKTNVIGTRNVLRAAETAGVERFVNISTDKAAEPTSVLGMTKRVAERLTASAACRSEGNYLSVRFGNVLGSRGSVLTAWAAQIGRGGPVTVTHPDVTRYFMTIPEACQLVLQAGAIGHSGEALILDMGEPVRLDDVARKLIRQSGRPIEIVYTGLRHGEKMHEILRSEAEQHDRPQHGLITHVDVPPLPVSFVAGHVAGRHEALSMLAQWCEAPQTTGGPTSPVPGDGPVTRAAPRSHSTPDVRPAARR